MLRSGAEIARPLAFDPMVHVTVKPNHVCKAGLSNKPVATQMSDARIKYLIDCKPRQSGKPTVRPNSDFCDTCGSAVQNEDQRQ